MPEPIPEPEPELPREEVPLPEGELLSVDELPTPLSEESWTPSAPAVLLSSWPLCWMFCER